MRRPIAVVAAGAAVGVAFDVLAWGKAPGLSFPLLVAALVALVLGVARAQGVTPSPRALALLVPLGLLALVPALRREPLTVSLAVALCLGLGGLFAATLRSGAWLRFGVRDHVVAAVGLTAGSVAAGARTVVAAAAATRGGAGRRRLRSALPAVRGVVLAVPVVGVFVLLLGSADPVFAARLGAAVDWVPPLSLPRPGLRSAVAAAVAFLATGVAVHAATAAPRPLVEGPPLPRRLRPVEAAIMLGSVVALFAVFVATQVQVALGGEEAVAAAGITYASYARRGFFELVVVALCSLALLLALAGTTARESVRERRLFSSLAGALVALVLVLLVSAALRLGLYEQAYGFTRTRVAAHVLMAWIGVLLVAAGVLEVRQRLRAFPVAVLAAAVGLVLTLAAINVDGVVAARNLDRAVRGVGVPLDSAYLAGLSTDAVPTLAAAADRPAAAAALACIARRAEGQPWQSAALSTWRAQRVLADLDLPAVGPGRCRARSGQAGVSAAAP